jgi:hypothetical protein
MRSKSKRPAQHFRAKRGAPYAPLPTVRQPTSLVQEAAAPAPACYAAFPDAA